MVVKIKRRGFYGKDKKTAMCECVNGRKKEKGKVSFRQLSEFQKAVNGGVPGVVGFSIPEKRAGTAAIIITREAERNNFMLLLSQMILLSGWFLLLYHYILRSLYPGRHSYLRYQYYVQKSQQQNYCQH